MANAIAIKDQDAQGFLTVDLVDLLKVLEPEGLTLVWSILDLEARGDPTTCMGVSMLELESRVEGSINGLVVSWGELISIAKCLDEVLETTIVGCRDITSISQRGRVEDLYGSCEIVVEAIDSALWRVYAKDDAILKRFQVSFQDVEAIQPE